MFRLLIQALFVAAPFLYWLRRRSRQSLNPEGLPLPPGPPRKPLIGNALDFPRLHAWHKFTEWKNQYGMFSPSSSSSSLTPHNR
jgi:hypothetical protein